MYKFIFIVFLLFQLQPLLFGQQNKKILHAPLSFNASVQSDSIEQNFENITWYRMFTDVPSDYYNFFKQTFTIKNIPTLVAVSALTGSLFLIDQTGWKYGNTYFHKNQVYHSVANIAVNMGDGKYQFLSAALFALPGIIINDKTAIKTGSNIAEAIISTGIFVQILKRMTGRQSPVASTENGGDWDPFPSIKQYQKDQPAFYSFPSGHLSTATAVLTVIANNYPNDKWIKPVGYPLLAVLGASLIGKGMHWFSDFPLAFLLGYTFGNIIAPVKNTSVHNDEKSSLTFVPSIGFNDIGIGLRYNF